MDVGDLTQAQQKVLRFVFRKISVGEASPSFGEIAAHFGYRSRMAAHKHVQALERKGYLKRTGDARGLRLREKAWQLFGIPILGKIPAGKSASEAEFLGALTPFDLYPQGEGHFALEVSGRSMARAGILPNDYVIVCQDVETRSGDIVVAQVDELHGDATVKRLAEREGQRWLDPESDDPSIEPIALNGGRILGKVVRVHCEVP